MYLSWFLLCFEALSGMRINLKKKALFCLCGDVENPELLALEFGCNLGSLPTTCIGLPLGAKHKPPLFWTLLRKNFEEGLSSRKRQYISKEGRLTLIQSTLSCTPTYLMSLFQYLKSCQCKTRKNPKRFTLGGTLERKTQCKMGDCMLKQR